MFVKGSRYRKVVDDVTTDVKGRTLPAKSFRAPPQVQGTFLHTVTQGDRLDQLAYQYYQEPRKWWRICDANPAFLSPQALLGQATLVTARFPVSWAGLAPPWGLLLQALRSQVGVEDVMLEEGEPGGNATNEQTLRVIFNRVNISVEEISAAIMAALAGLPNDLKPCEPQVTSPEIVGQVGKPIVIPPDTIG